MKVIGTLLAASLIVFSVYFLFFKSSVSNSNLSSSTGAEFVDTHRSSVISSVSKLAESAAANSVSSVSSGADEVKGFSSRSLSGLSSLDSNSASSTGPENSNARLKRNVSSTATGFTPKQYAGHELADVSPYIRPRQQMYKNPRSDAFGVFGIPVAEVNGCVYGDEEIDDAKYLWTCAVFLHDRYFTENGMTHEEGEAILKRIRLLYIKAASLGHVFAMSKLSGLVISSAVGRENIYSHDEQFLPSKIESMAWFLAGEMVGVSNRLPGSSSVKVLLTEADESSIRAAEEMALFFIDFYGIPSE